MRITTEHKRKKTKPPTAKNRFPGAKAAHLKQATGNLRKTGSTLGWEKTAPPPDHQEGRCTGSETDLPFSGGPGWESLDLRDIGKQDAPGARGKALLQGPPAKGCVIRGCLANMVVFGERINWLPGGWATDHLQGQKTRGGLTHPGPPEGPVCDWSGHSYGCQPPAQGDHREKFGDSNM